MAKPIVMPQVGQDIETGVIIEWRVKENDYVKRGDVIALVESDKATFEVEAYEAGVLLKLLYDVGAEVKVLDPIAYVGEPGETVEELQVAEGSGEARTQASPAKKEECEEQAEQRSKGGVSVSPSAKRVAREHGIDLSAIIGSGPDGRILKQDVLAAIPVTAAGSEARTVMKAFLFDCDGVLVDTERDGHRVAFNKTFAAKGYAIDWDVELYGKLLKVSGGKERMKHYFDRYGWPDDVADRDALIKELHKLKTDFFMQIIESGELPLRPGVARLVDEAIAANIMLAVCSTSHERAVHLVVERLLGPQCKARFSAILAGDVVSKKKPDPEIYNLASQRLGLEPCECVVVEDSRNGLLAAKAAGMYCIVTTNSYTEDEDFAEADIVVSELGDEPNAQVTLEEIKRIVEDS
ncbi:MAG: HAD-IA family hydrolase [Planctomycetota bacterium]|jgi:HAD superfamily hydrolase (TIGR01509 family)